LMTSTQVPRGNTGVAPHATVLPERKAKALHHGPLGDDSSHQPSLVAAGLGTRKCSGKRGSTMGYPATQTEEESLNEARYQRCFHQADRFFFFGNNWGRHFNHVTSVVAALVLAQAANRTLVMPVFNVGARAFTMADLYNVTSLFDVRSSPYCVLAEHEFFALEESRWRIRQGGAVAGGVTVAAACISMRGIKMHPQRPQAFRIVCDNEVFIKYKKNLTLFYDTVVRNQASPAYTARFLTVPLVIYYAEALSKELTACPWQFIQPHGVVRQAVAVFQSLGDTVGVHMRSLEGSCADRVASFAREQRIQLERQCHLTVAYLKEIASSGGLKLESATVIVADDGQNVGAVRGLLKLVPRGVRPQDLLDASAPVSPFRYRQFFSELRRGALEGYGFQFPFTMNSRQYASVESFLVVQVDFWLLALSSVFVGNQMSTLSQNVCRWRTANGKRCDNFV
jgi:hypothetical protein